MGSKWLDEFDGRQRDEIRFCLLYEREFHHGTDGHNAKVIISQMAKMLDAYEQQLCELKMGAKNG